MLLANLSTQQAGADVKEFSFKIKYKQQYSDLSRLSKHTEK